MSRQVRGKVRWRDDIDALELLTQHVAALETKVDTLLDHRLIHMKTRRYFLTTIKRLRVEKSGLLKYIRELEGFLKVQREGDKDV